MFITIKFIRISIENTKYIKINKTGMQNIQLELPRRKKKMTEQELNFLENIPKKPQIDISYIDGDGNHTNRRVIVLTYRKKEFPKAGFITAYCEKEKDIRSFRFDRIQICKNLGFRY